MGRLNYNRIKINYGTFQERLIVPLWIRAVESKKVLPLLVDRKACEIYDTIDFNYTDSLVKLSELDIISHISVSRIFDETINRFVISNPEGTIVNIGCGMDTYYERAINNSLNWFELDLPEVIDFRKLFINETNNRKFIIGSFLNTCWLNQIGPNEKVLFIASDLFCYFREENIKGFILMIANNFPSAELLFDVVSVWGFRNSNLRFKKKGLDQISYLKWAPKNKDVLLSWDSRLSIKNSFPVYKHVSKSLSIKNRILGSISDFFIVRYIIHLVVN